ncbi:MAG: tRNA preQ1(34) S-adenosylmethionine ribosyltransferase-isomerase QueA, partial [Pseudomonadota bacterium]
MRTDQFDFHLPEERIALHPAKPRDAALMLCVQPHNGSASESHTAKLIDAGVRDLPDYLRAGDVLVVNDTRVIKAALLGTRLTARAHGGPARQPQITVNLHRRVNDTTWRAFAKPVKRLQVGDEIGFGGQKNGPVIRATVRDLLGSGEIALAFDVDHLQTDDVDLRALTGNEKDPGLRLDAVIAAVGEMPLPPYIASKRPIERADATSYQTVFAARAGAVAAPTAALHFSDALNAKLTAKGIERINVTLHVSAGTFLPVKVDDVSDHRMHAEWGEITAEACSALNAARARGGRICCVGTTSLRLLESATDENGVVHPFSDETDIFISPGYRFRACDILMTNFHLPKSTLFMLVSAFSGLDTMQAAYRHAIDHAYR